MNWIVFGIELRIYQENSEDNSKTEPKQLWIFLDMPKLPNIPAYPNETLGIGNESMFLQIPRESLGSRALHIPSSLIPLLLVHIDQGKELAPFIRDVHLKEMPARTLYFHRHESWSLQCSSVKLYKAGEYWNYAM